MRFRTLTLTLLLAALPLCACAQHLILIDQDGAGPGGSDQASILLLLQSPQVRVLGITMVSGDAWEPEEVQHTLRMLELVHRTDVPVVPGAVFPLLRTREQTIADRPVTGSFEWYGAFGNLAKPTGDPAYHPPFEVPALPEGAPATRPLDEDAAHFLIRQVRAHPHQVTIFAAGPLTNIALALSLDPHFAELTAGIAIMGGSMDPQTGDPEFATHPRHEFNFWFDPEAAHIVLRAAWPRIELTTVDISIKTRFTPAMLAQIAASSTPAAQYLARYTHDFTYMWDELTAAALIDPAIITRTQTLYVDVDTGRGPNYGDTLTWTAANRPANVQAAQVQTDVDLPRFYALFIRLMQTPPHPN